MCLSVQEVGVRGAMANVTVVGPIAGMDLSCVIIEDACECTTVQMFPGRSVMVDDTVGGAVTSAGEDVCPAIGQMPYADGGSMTCRP